MLPRTVVPIKGMREFSFSIISKGVINFESIVLPEKLPISF